MKIDGTLQVGCIVRRISGSHNNMYAGDTDKVVYIDPRDFSVNLEHYGNGHTGDKFKVISINWKKRLRGK